MRRLLGLNEAKWQQGVVEPVIQSIDHLINGHMMFVGMSGTGKSWQIKALLKDCDRLGIQADVFDVAEELHTTQGARAVKFSASSRFGFNPLVLNANPDSGGVHNQIDFVVRLLNNLNTKLGARQESALRSLLADVYYLRGCYPDNPRSWQKEQITEQLWEQLTRANDYGALRAYYPTLRDVISFAERKLKQLSIGAEGTSINALNRVEATAAKIQALMIKHRRSASDAEVVSLQDQLEREKAKAIEQYANFISSIEFGCEYKDAQKYTNADTLRSLVERLQMLQDAAIFCATQPDFGNALIRAYHIGSLSDEKKRLLVYNRLQQILQQAIDSGIKPALTHIVVLDEGHLYLDSDSQNPLNMIAKIGRKYGLGLVIGSTSPEHFSRDFYTNCGTLVLTGIHSDFWPDAIRSMGISKDLLTAVQGQAAMAVKMHVIGESAGRFMLVNVREDDIRKGIDQLRSAQAAA